MSDIGEFEMYHDLENEAAITVYTDPMEETVIVGITFFLSIPTNAKTT